MSKPQLSWYDVHCDEFFLMFEEICEQDGTVTLMYGGYGHYYKISWQIGGKHDFISAETPVRLQQLIREAQLSGRFQATGIGSHQMGSRRP